MTDSIMAIPLLIGVLYLVLFTYRKVRVDLFRDKVFQIRRSLFLIAADDPDVFFQGNSPYRFFETILNTTLSCTEDFSLISSILDTAVRVEYAKKNNIELFDFDFVKKVYLKKIKTPETRKEVATLIDNFVAHYALFLMTRIFFGLIFFSITIICIGIFLALQALYENRREALKRMALFYSNKMMNTSQFAYAASQV
jgi:hypothetical protein